METRRYKNGFNFLSLSSGDKIKYVGKSNGNFKTNLTYSVGKVGSDDCVIDGKVVSSLNDWEPSNRRQ